MSGISYIVTLYNKRDFIPWMIKGLESQTGDFEKQFVFMDDGSTDGSLDLVRELTAGWDNTLYLEQPNQGPAIATNRAVEHAVHPWLKPVDGDDVLAPYAGSLMLKVARQYDAVAVYAWPEAGRSHIDYADGIAFDPEPATVEDAGPRLLEDALSEVVEKGWSGSSNAFFSAQAFRDVGGCDERVFIQDVSPSLRLSPLNRTVFIKTLVCFGPDDLSKRMMGSNHQMLHDLTATQYWYLRDHPALPERLKAIIYRRAVGRAWKWARRENGDSVLSAHFRRYAAARLGLPTDRLRAIGKSLEAFRERHAVRVPPAGR
jgi:glycosyltransferase involved in cell wall biosynthesis